jgi:hypothetical protein
MGVQHKTAGSVDNFHEAATYRDDFPILLALVPEIPQLHSATVLVNIVAVGVQNLRGISTAHDCFR